jgi:ABC-type sugar transport system ATPase subunit
MLEGVEREGDGILCRVGSATLRVDGRPELGVLVGKTIAVGIRPEALDAPGRWPDAGTLRGKVQSVEALGPEQLAYVAIEGRTVLVEDVLERLVRQAQAGDLADLIDADGRATIAARLDAGARSALTTPIEPLSTSAACTSST